MDEAPIPFILRHGLPTCELATMDAMTRSASQKPEYGNVSSDLLIAIRSDPSIPASFCKLATDAVPDISRNCQAVAMLPTTTIFERRAGGTWSATRAKRCTASNSKNRLTCACPRRTAMPDREIPYPAAPGRYPPEKHSGLAQDSQPGKMNPLPGQV